MATGRGDDRKDRINRRKEKMLLNGRTRKEKGSCLFYTLAAKSASKSQLSLSTTSVSFRKKHASICHKEEV